MRQAFRYTSATQLSFISKKKIYIYISQKKTVCKQRRKATLRHDSKVQ